MNRRTLMKRLRPRPYSYRIVEFLGEGLNGCVYRAVKEDEATGIHQEVALKILKSKKMVDIWRSEFDRLMRIRSPNCVSLLGWEWIDDCPALVLELVEGVSLTILLNQGDLTCSDFDFIKEQIHAGLLELNRSGVVHGDLNPNNIMINTSGVVKLVDFGLFGAAGDFFVTPEFAHPDLLSGQTPSHESDQYSLQKINDRFKPVLKNSSKPSSAQILGKKVRRALELHRLRRLKTQAIPFSTSSRWQPAMLRKLAILSCILCIFGDGPHLFGESHHSAPLGATLYLRTSQWAVVTIDGRSKYSPAVFEIEGNRATKLEFQTADGSGISILTVATGDSIVLTDDYFRIHSARHSSRAD